MGRLRNKSAAPSQKARCAATEPSSSRYVTRAQTDRVDINNDDFRTPVHAALLLSSQEEAAAVITQNLDLFLSVLIGGDVVLDDVVDDQDDDSINEEDDGNLEYVQVDHSR
ncbi:hypothetical protein JTB14_002084 [Gonioctena quinquepunctata]|nr:hypothetical protein JTB14_002084 [Gonioctena quinquepunctata]